MTRPAADPGLAQAHLELRRARVRDAVERPVHTPGERAEPLPAERVEHLRREGEDLYWNELSWEQITDEELVAGGRLTELVFPGFLAFVDGLLLEEGPARSSVAPRPHPEVVEGILLFLAERYASLTAELEAGADSEQIVWARALTGQLLDLVLYRLYGLTAEEREEIDAVD